MRARAAGRRTAPTCSRTSRCQSAREPLVQRLRAALLDRRLPDGAAAGAGRLGLRLLVVLARRDAVVLRERRPGGVDGARTTTSRGGGSRRDGTAVLGHAAPTRPRSYAAVVRAHRGRCVLERDGAARARAARETYRAVRGGRASSWSCSVRPACRWRRPPHASEPSPTRRRVTGRCTPRRGGSWAGGIATAAIADDEPVLLALARRRHLLRRRGAAERTSAGRGRSSFFLRFGSSSSCCASSSRSSSATASPATSLFSLPQRAAPLVGRGREHRRAGDRRDGAPRVAARGSDSRWCSSPSAPPTRSPARIGCSDACPPSSTRRASRSPSRSPTRPSSSSRSAASARPVGSGVARRAGIAGLRGLAVPVLEGALDRSLELASSMDARGYGRRAGRARRDASAGDGATTALGLLGLVVGIYDAAQLVGAVGVGVARARRRRRAPRRSASCSAGGARDRTRYRPDVWRLAEWSVSLSGLAVVVAFSVAGALRRRGPAGDFYPLAFPPVPPLLVRRRCSSGSCPRSLAPAPAARARREPRPGGARRRSDQMPRAAMIRFEHVTFTYSGRHRRRSLARRRRSRSPRASCALVVGHDGLGQVHPPAGDERPRAARDGRSTRAATCRSPGARPATTCRGSWPTWSASSGRTPRRRFVTDVVEDELAYTMENLGVAPAAMRRRVEDTLDLLGLHELRRRSLRTLSGGQQQRVAIGAVLTAVAARPRARRADLGARPRGGRGGARASLSRWCTTSGSRWSWPSTASSACCPSPTG